MAGHVRSVMLVRHGRTAYNAGHRLQGQVDIALDEVGRWQVARTGETLRELYVDRRPQTSRRIVVSSDLTRAMETAHAFADPLGIEVHPDPRVRERDFGDWDGVAVAELAERYPEDYRLWTEHRGGEMRHGAEPKSHVAARGVEALLDWSSRGDDDADLFVFSHGAWIAQTIQHLLRMDVGDPGYGGMMGMRNAHWARLLPLDLDDGGVRWRLLDYDHGPALADTPRWEDPFGEARTDGD